MTHGHGFVQTDSRGRQGDGLRRMGGRGVKRVHCYLNTSPIGRPTLSLETESSGGHGTELLTFD